VFPLVQIIVGNLNSIVEEEVKRYKTDYFDQSGMVNRQIELYCTDSLPA